MSFKTISLSEDAYKILKRAKRSPRQGCGHSRRAWNLAKASRLEKGPYL